MLGIFHKHLELPQYIQHQSNMKKLIALILLCSTLQIVNAQLFTREKVLNNENFDKPFLSWGYYLGFNSYDYKFEYNENKPDILVTSSIGFNVGLIGNMRINEFFDLRFEPGLVITNRELGYDESYFTDLDFDESDLIREVKSTYIHFPLLVKFSALRLNNFKPFIEGGISASINLASNEDNPNDNASGQFRTKTNVYFYELGFGIDFYLPYFKFTPSIRGVFALNDELIRDEDPDSPWTSNVTSMKTRGVFINLTFQ